MTTEPKTPVCMDARVSFTAAEGDESSGAITALVSAYDVKYLIGWRLWHTIEAGAFTDSIAEQAAIPLFWQHSWQYTEQAPIGHATAEETDEGLVITGTLYVDADPSIARVYEAMKAGAIREWSIGYRVLEIRTDSDDDDHEFVTKGELLEASSVLRGANPETKTLQVASQLLGRDLTESEAASLAAGGQLDLATKPEQITDPVTKAALYDADPVTVGRLYQLDSAPDNSTREGDA